MSAPAVQPGDAVRVEVTLIVDTVDRIVRGEGHPGVTMLTYVAGGYRVYGSEVAPVRLTLEVPDDMPNATVRVLR